MADRDVRESHRSGANLYDRPLLKDLVGILAGIVLRTSRGPLGPLWMALHGALTKALCRFLARPAGAAVYIRGSFADGEAVPGLSDIDLIVVTPDRELVERRWARVRPGLDPLVSVKVYGADELEAVAADTILVQPPSFFEDGRHFSLRTRPGLAGATRDWTLLRGPDLRPARHGAPDPCVIAWLELQCWWRYAVWAAANPDNRLVPYMCFKLVAEGTRAWLWLAHGELTAGRTAALRRGLELMPDDTEALHAALALHEALHRQPRADLDATLAWFVGITERVGALVDARAAKRPDATVRLELDGKLRAGRLPLKDWRALVVPEDGPREVTLASGNPRRAADLAEADRADPPHLLRADGIFLIPSSDLESRPLTRGSARIVQCAASDPVTTALLAGETVARFSDIPGWRASDWGLVGEDPALQLD